MALTFQIELTLIQPSQLFISELKLSGVKSFLKSGNTSQGTPIPIIQLDNQWIYTDGHTRAYQAFKMGLDKIRVELDEDRPHLDMEMYRICVQWCKEANIRKIQDLEGRILDEKDYQVQWHERCKIMQAEVLSKRKTAIYPAV